MFNLVRKIVAGPKNRTVDEKYDLDLTYITNNIIAMAFPATGIQKTYRNSIDDVVKFLKQKHGNHYLIINASNRTYDYQKFNNQVLEFFWTDHQAPPLTTLFEVCQKIFSFLEENEKNVVAVHCNHGKGRTGTAIISYLLYSQQFDDVKQALKFYNSQRFSGNKYGVDQPCQLRYLNFFKSFLELPMDFISQPLKAFKLTRATQKGLKQEQQLSIRISQTRSQHVIYPSVSLNEGNLKFARPLIGDIFIELVQNNWSGAKQILRINYHLAFLTKNVQTKVYQVIFMGDQIKMKHSKNQFQLTLEFQQFCHCHNKIPKQQCMCHTKRQREQKYWDNMITIIKKNRKRHQSQHEEKIENSKGMNEIVNEIVTQIQPYEKEMQQQQQQN